MVIFDNDTLDKSYDQLLLLARLIDRFEYELVEFKEADYTIGGRIYVDEFDDVI